MSTKSFKPSEVIQNYIKKKLHKSTKLKMTPSLDRRMKVYVLDKIFQSMADLTYFLEQMATNPKLEKVFRKDLEDLFDMRPEYKVNQLHPHVGAEEGIRIQETAFTRLIFASLLPDDEKFLTYRMRMMNTLQGIIYVKTKFTLNNTFGAKNQVTKSAIDDMRNAIGWTAMMGKHDRDPDYEAKRLLGFPAPYRKLYSKK